MSEIGRVAKWLRQQQPQRFKTTHQARKQIDACVRTSIRNGVAWRDNTQFCQIGPDEYRVMVSYAKYVRMSSKQLERFQLEIMQSSLENA